MGDLGLGFTNPGEAGPGFLTVFADDAVDAGAGLGAVLVGGFDTTGGRLARLFSSFAKFFFTSFGGSTFVAALFAGETVFDGGCLPDAFALVGVRGTAGAEFFCLVSEAAGAVDGADGAAG